MSLCECGCGREAKPGNRYILGHHAKGRRKSDEEKKKIGDKNSVHMKCYYKEHPEIAAARVELMIANHDEEFHKKRVEATKKTYAEMTPEDKQKFSDHTKKLWNSGSLMFEACAKAAETRNQRFKEGVYDLTERNLKISETITKRYLSGGFEWSKGEYKSSKAGCTCYYRSSWELALMQILDGDELVETWEYEFDSIDYELDGVKRKYIPDFHVITSAGEHTLVEVKPENLRETAMNVTKKVAAIMYCEARGWHYSEWKLGDDCVTV
jgi:hypothetical protein